MERLPVVKIHVIELADDETDDVEDPLLIAPE